MIESKSWDWSRNKEEKWLIPCVESPYLAERWTSLGFNKFLDIGCGLGRHSIYMAEKGVNVTALDLSEYGVDHLKKWAYEKGLNVNTVVSDMLKLPFEDNSFDCIMAYNVIFHTDGEGLVQIVNEIKRVLKPKGEFFVTLLSKGHWSYVASAGTVIDKNTIIRNDKPTEDNVPHFYMDFNEVNEFFNDWEFVDEPVEICEYSRKDSKKVKKHWKMLIKKLD